MRSGHGPHPLACLPVIFVAGVCAVLPLLLHGISCGQDMPFHLQSWLDAAAQLRQGHYPHWAISPAWNAGEPRFLFYPPISWLFGAGLTMLLPVSAAPVVYIFAAVTAAGLAMHHLARQFVSPTAAILASVFYLANPYMLFCAMERTAFAELLAAAWFPLLLLGVLKVRPTVRGIAMPIALLWLTNAPAAVMGCYTFALLAAVRVAAQSFTWPKENGALLTGQSSAQLTAVCLQGTVLGLALPAYYLVPAAYERRFVQVAMAIIPNMRYQDNFLFTRTADAAHNAVNQTASTLALSLLLFTALAWATLLLLRRRDAAHRTTAVSGMEGGTHDPSRAGPQVIFSLVISLVIATLFIALLLTPLSAPLWAHLPNMAFLQFPWRWLAVLSAVLSLAIALLLERLLPAQIHLSQQRSVYAASPLLAVALSFGGYSLYAQACDPPSLPSSIAALFRTGHGAPPTDEYTPTAADNDVLRTDNPGYWLASSADAAAPHTTPTAAELNPNVATDDTPVPDAQTLSAPAPHHLVVRTMGPRYLVLNLRDYPNWDVNEADPSAMTLHHPEHIARDDGLIAIYLDHTDEYTIDIAWHCGPDQSLGLIASALALIALAITFLRQRMRSVRGSRVSSKIDS